MQHRINDRTGLHRMSTVQSGLPYTIMTLPATTCRLSKRSVKAEFPQGAKHVPRDKKAPRFKQHRLYADRNITRVYDHEGVLSTVLFTK